MDISTLSSKFWMRSYTYFNYQITTIVSSSFYFNICIVLYPSWNCNCLISSSLLSPRPSASITKFFYFFTLPTATLANCLHYHHALLNSFKPSSTTRVTINWCSPWFRSRAFTCSTN